MLPASSRQQGARTTGETHGFGFAARSAGLLLPCGWRLAAARRPGPFAVSAEQPAPGRRREAARARYVSHSHGLVPRKSERARARPGPAAPRLVSCRVCCVMAALRACVPVQRTRIVVLLEWNSPVHLLCSGLRTAAGYNEPARSPGRAARLCTRTS